MTDYVGIYARAYGGLREAVRQILAGQIDMAMLQRHVERIDRELADALPDRETAQGEPRVWRVTGAPGGRTDSIGALYRHNGVWETHAVSDKWVASAFQSRAEMVEAGYELIAVDASVEPQRCQRCGKNPVWLRDNPDVHGRFCAACIDRCHEATEFGHKCPVCTEAPASDAQAGGAR